MDESTKQKSLIKPINMSYFLFIRILLTSSLHLQPTNQFKLVHHIEPVQPHAGPVLFNDKFVTQSGVRGQLALRGLQAAG